MIRNGHNEMTRFFAGTEIEHTPAFGKRTMFVVGVQSIDQIEWAIGETDRKNREQITHIYFGANQSFPNLNINDADTWRAWENMIRPFLDRGYWCTLDIDVSSVEGLLEGVIIEHSLFIPMISVKLPYIQQLGYNATIKLDDKDFKATNPGVWCHNLHDLKDRNKFTTWDKYTKDEVIK
jgi:hypothetical protein